MQPCLVVSYAYGAIRFITSNASCRAVADFSPRQKLGSVLVVAIRRGVQAMALFSQSCLRLQIFELRAGHFIGHWWGMPTSERQALGGRVANIRSIIHTVVILTSYIY